MKPLPMPRVTGEEMRLINTILAGISPVTFHLGEAKFQVVFQAEAEDYAPALGLALASGPVQVRLGLGGLFFAEPLAAFLEGDDLNRLPGEIRAAVAEAALEEILEAFDHWQGDSTTIHTVLLGSLPENLAVTLYFRLRRLGDDRECAGHLSLDHQGLTRLANLAGRLTPDPAGGRPALPVRGWVEIGATELSLAEFTELEPHDIVLLDESAFAPGGEARFRIPGASAWQGGLADGRFTVLAFKEELMSEHHSEPDAGLENPEAAAPETAPHLDALPVRLTFTLGEKTIPLAELQALKPGMALDLDVSATRPVTVRANGQAIGTGELLEIDGRAGVRIVELFKDADR